jgi:hypothetical protein
MLLNENHPYYGFGLSMRDKSMFGVGRISSVKKP